MQVHIEKGVIKAQDLTAMIEELESYGSRGLGARIIAKYAVHAANLLPVPAATCINAKLASCSPTTRACHVIWVKLPTKSLNCCINRA